MVSLFLVLYLVSPFAEDGTGGLPLIVLRFSSAEACLQAVGVFSSIGQTKDVEYAPHSRRFRAECRTYNPAAGPSE
jgi:hypothetical protein